MTLQEIASQINLDLNRTLALFMGKEEMYVKYLKKYPENARRILSELKTAVENDDYKGIESGAHGLKGVSANLGLQTVSEHSEALVMDIRAKTYANISKDHQQLVEHAELAIECIEKLD